MNSKNPGYDPNEIAKLKAECAEEGSNFVLVEDDQDFSDTGEYVQFQFVGKYNGEEVIYDAALFTLELHYGSMVVEAAEEKVKKIDKNFVSIEERGPGYKPNEESDALVQEFIEELEEEDAIKVSEFCEMDFDFDFGIGLEVALNVGEITEEIITKFIEDFNAGTLELDKDLYSFKEDEE